MSARPDPVDLGGLPPAARSERLTDERSGSAGLADPAVVWTEGLLAAWGRETFGRPGVKVRRPCHNMGAGLPTPPWSGPKVRFGAGLPTPPWSGPKVSWRRGDGRPSVGRVSRSETLPRHRGSTGHRVRRGSPDPAVVRTEGLLAAWGRETFGRPGVKVRRPCHNMGPVRRVSRPRRGPDRRSPGGVGTGDLRSAGCRRSGDLATTWVRFGAGLPTPPWSGPKVSWRRGDGRLRSAGCQGQETLPQHGSPDPAVVRTWSWPSPR